VLKVVSACQPKLGLSVENRLRTGKEFQAVFSSERIVSPHFVLYYRTNCLGSFRVGASVKKRHVKQAVRRNRIKRLSKEGARCRATVLAGLDLVILARKTVSTLQPGEYRACIEQLFERLERRQRRSSSA
jgi:ribonuclease P protein component